MRILWVAMVALMAFAAGCGGSDDDASTDSPSARATEPAAGSLTRADVVERGDELCSGYKKRAGAIQDAAKGSEDAQEIAEALREIGREAERIIDPFRKLAARAPDREVLRRYVSTSKEQIVLLNRAADQYGQGDPESGLAVLEAGRETGSELRGIAQGYGFKVCGPKTED